MEKRQGRGVVVVVGFFGSFGCFLEGSKYCRHIVAPHTLCPLFPRAVPAPVVVPSPLQHPPPAPFPSFLPSFFFFFFFSLSPQAAAEADTPFETRDYFTYHRCCSYLSVSSLSLLLLLKLVNFFPFALLSCSSRRLQTVWAQAFVVFSICWIIELLSWCIPARDFDLDSVLRRSRWVLPSCLLASFAFLLFFSCLILSSACFVYSSFFFFCLPSFEVILCLILRHFVSLSCTSFVPSCGHFCARFLHLATSFSTMQ